MKRFFLAIVILAFLLSLLTGVTKVEPGERAVVRRFGRVLKDKPQPGLYIGWPWGIDRVNKVKVDRVRSVTIGYAPAREDEPDFDNPTPPGQLLTGDHNLVNLQAVIYYAVREDEVERFVFQQQRAATLVARTAESVLTEWVAGRTYDTVFKRGKQTMRDAKGERPLRDLLVEKTQAHLEEYELGVVVQDARVTFLSPPSEVKDAYDNVTRAETQMKTQENQARQYYDQMLQDGEAERYRIVTEAKSAARGVKLLAEAEAKNFENRLALYHKLRKTNPQYLNVIWWNEMSQLYAKMRTGGRLGLLDHQLGTSGVDITTVPSLPKK